MKQPACHMGVKARCAPCLRKKENSSNSSDNWFSPSSQHPPSQLTGIHHGRHNIDRASHRPEFQQLWRWRGGPSDSTSPPKLHTTHLGRHFRRFLEFRSLFFTCQPPSQIYYILQAFYSYQSMKDAIQELAKSPH